jgi:hypothetical protein
MCYSVAFKQLTYVLQGLGFLSQYLIYIVIFLQLPYFFFVLSVQCFVFVYTALCCICVCVCVWLYNSHMCSLVFTLMNTYYTEIN